MVHSLVYQLRNKAGQTLRAVKAGTSGLPLYRFADDSEGEPVAYASEEGAENGLNMFAGRDLDGNYTAEIVPVPDMRTANGGW